MHDEERAARICRWGEHMRDLATVPKLLQFCDLPVRHTQGHIEKLEREGRFPPRTMVRGKPVWDRAEVAAWAEAYGKSRKPKRNAPSDCDDDID